MALDVLKNSGKSTVIRIKSLTCLIAILMFSTFLQAQNAERFGTIESLFAPAGGTDNSYQINNYPITVEPNRILLVAVSYQAAATGFNFVSDVTWKGNSMTRAYGGFLNLIGTDLYTLTFPGNNSLTGDIEVTISGTMTNVSVHVMTFRHVSGNNPISGFVINGSSLTNNSSVNISSSDTEDLFVDFLRLEQSPGLFTPGPDQTVLVSDPSELVAISEQRGIGSLTSSWALGNSLSQGNVHIGLLVNAGNDVLPVELKYFEANIADKHTALNWATETEVENLGFEVEWSLDAVSWERIGFIQGAGNSDSPIEYDYLDKTPQAGTNYYRLKQVNFDGTFSHSETKSVKFENTAIENWTIYPNPAIHELNIDNITGKAVIYDLLGEVKMVIDLDSKFNRINISSLTPGPHAIRVTTPDGELISKAFTKH